VKNQRLSSESSDSVSSENYFGGFQSVCMKEPLEVLLDSVAVRSYFFRKKVIILRTVWHNCPKDNKLVKLIDFLMLDLHASQHVNIENIEKFAIVFAKMLLRITQTSYHCGSSGFGIYHSSLFS
jgi:hypothetical protein